MKLPDAVQAASAIAINADALVTRDRDFFEKCHKPRATQAHKIVWPEAEHLAKRFEVIARQIASATGQVGIGSSI